MPKVAKGIFIKTDEEIKIMMEGGKRLFKIKNEVKKNIKEGVKASEIEDIVTDLIKKAGGKPSFKMVPGYSWSTCVNVNDGLVHGIPKDSVVFNQGDIVSVDVGIYYKGFHTDTSFSVGVGIDKDKQEFLKAGEKTLLKAIEQTRPGNRIYDISEKIEQTLKKHKLSPVKALVGHGIGKKLHEEPQVPCFVRGAKNDSPTIVKGMVLAIEVMYAKGRGTVRLDEDGWTIATRDGKISALFEETVAIGSKGPLVLTESNLV